MALVFISAENPKYQPQSASLNWRSMMHLRADLLSAGHRPKLAVFIDKKTGYREKSFRVRMPIREAIVLGKKYGQKSVYVDGRGVLDLDELTYNPQIGKVEGRKALVRPTHTVVPSNLGQSVSYDVDFNTSRRLRA